MQHFVTEAIAEQLIAIKNSIAQCARKAQKAGIDAIEIHGDRLLGSLCSTVLNHRTDNYGGSLENRTRYHKNFYEQLKKRLHQSWSNINFQLLQLIQMDLYVVKVVYWKMKRLNSQKCLMKQELI